MVPNMKVIETEINIMGNNGVYEHTRPDNGPEFTAREVKLVGQVSHGQPYKYVTIRHFVLWHNVILLYNLVQT